MINIMFVLLAKRALSAVFRGCGLKNVFARFVAIRACRPEVCRLFDQGQQL